MKYTKPALSFDQQAKLLISRGSSLISANSQHSLIAAQSVKQNRHLHIS